MGTNQSKSPRRPPLSLSFETAFAPSRFDELPREIFRVIASLLLGFDLFALSHVNHCFRRLLVHDGIWLARLSPTAGGDSNVEARRRYLASRSYRFCGRELRVQRLPSRGSCVELPQWLLAHLGAFSFDLWFGLLPPPAAADVHVGGILLGAQSMGYHNPAWPGHHHPLVHVDPHGSLYCSVTRNKPVVAAHLVPHRWYHLALTFDGTQQLVYVDGRLRTTDDDGLHPAWHTLQHLQLGTGCVSGDALGKPTAAFVGWYGFRGLVDAFRVWPMCLPAEDIERLAACAALPSSSSCAYELPTATATLTTTPSTTTTTSTPGHATVKCGGPVKLVRCSRPPERVLHIEPTIPRPPPPNLRDKLWAWTGERRSSLTRRLSMAQS